MEKKIAVIMPVYNAEKFLSRSLDSVLNQTMGDLVVICVNDKSSDKSLELLNEYAKKDDRVIVLNHDINKGSGQARNTALDYIYSNNIDVEYITMVDADDRIEPNTFEKAYSEAKDGDVDILNYNFLPSTYWQYKTEASNDVIDYDGNCVEVLFDFKEFYTFIVCWSKLYKKELLENIRFPETKFFEDGGFAYKVLPRAKKLRLIPDTLYEYNIENPDSTCSKVDNNKRFRAILETIKATMEDWKELGILDKYKNKYIEHILLYTSLVCPDAFEENYSSLLDNYFGFNITDENTINNLNEDTQGLILKMKK